MCNQLQVVQVVVGMVNYTNSSYMDTMIPMVDLHLAPRLRDEGSKQELRLETNRRGRFARVVCGYQPLFMHSTARVGHAP